MTRRHALSLGSIGVFAAIASSWASAAVVPVYQWREVDGTEAFSSEPPPASVSHYTLRRTVVQSSDAAHLAHVQACLARDRELILAPVKQDSLDISFSQVERAAAGLAAAGKAQELGREPLAGERLHNAGGGSRLTPDYFARQERLGAAVERAQAELDAARRVRDSQVGQLDADDEGRGLCAQGVAG